MGLRGRRQRRARPRHVLNHDATFPMCFHGRLECIVRRLMYPMAPHSARFVKGYLTLCVTAIRVTKTILVSADTSHEW